MRNLRAQPSVTVRIGRGGAELHATARVVGAGTDEDVMARGLLLSKYQAPGASDLESWGASALVVAVDLPSA